jgi:hypothetical protein
MRSATTVAGIVGQSFSSARIRSSKASTADVCRGRRYEGGSPDLTATRTVLRATPTRFAIVLMPKPSAKCSLRISAQSSTVSTSPLPERPAWSTQARPGITVRYGFRVERGQDSTGVRGSVLHRRRQQPSETDRGRSRKRSVRLTEERTVLQGKTWPPSGVRSRGGDSETVTPCRYKEGTLDGGHLDGGHDDYAGEMAQIPTGTSGLAAAQ